MSLVNKFLGKYVSLSLNVFGSFAVEKCFNHADVRRRVCFFPFRAAASVIARVATDSSLFVVCFFFCFFHNDRK